MDAEDVPFVVADVADASAEANALGT